MKRKEREVIKQALNELGAGFDPKTRQYSREQVMNAHSLLEGLDLTAPLRKKPS